jgi:hypothetical protein
MIVISQCLSVIGLWNMQRVQSQYAIYKEDRHYWTYRGMRENVTVTYIYEATNIKRALSISNSVEVRF